MLLATTLRMDRINPVILAPSQHDPVRLVLVIVIDMRWVEILSPAAGPPSNCDGLCIRGCVLVKYILIKTQLTGIITGDVEAVLTSLWCLEVSVPDLANFIGVVSCLLENKLKRLINQRPGWWVRGQVIKADTLSAAVWVILALDYTRLTYLVHTIDRGSIWIFSCYARDIFH